MKTSFRILIALAGIAAMVLGVRQMVTGIRTLAGQFTVAQAPVVGERVEVAAHGCSLKVPQGWQQKASQNGGVMYSAPKVASISANLIILSDSAPSTLRGYTDANIAQIQSMFPTAKLVKDAPFTTDAGVSAIKVTFENKFNDLKVTQFLYFLSGAGDRKIAVTCSVQTDRRAEVESVFDACLKTLTVTSPVVAKQ